MKRVLFWILLILAIIGMVGGLFYYVLRPQTQYAPPSSNESSNQTSTQETEKEVYPPIEFARARITRKPFAIYVSPRNSPVQPERFSGYHTATDFEVTPDEISQDIAVFAVCNGKILDKSIIAGYGGVIVQACNISGQPVTVLYGHINIARSDSNIGDLIEKGSRLSFLGDEKSFYTDGERKHLHVGIHRGEAIDYRGYVPNRNELSGWIDIAPYLP